MWDMHSFGILGVSWLQTRNGTERAHSILTNSWSVNLPHNMFFSLTGLKEMTEHSLAIQLSLSMAFNDGSMAGVNASTGASTQADLIYTKSADPNGGYGYRALVGNEMNGRALGGVTYVGDDVALDGSLAVQNGQPGLQAGADGAVVFMRGSIYATHNPGDAVALVDAGAPNVRVYLENREVGRSDEDGKTLVTGLNPHAPNQISVDARDYPFNADVTKTDMVVVPRRRAGVLADLSPGKDETRTLQVKNGTAVPRLGARIFIDGDPAPHVVGHDGMFQVTGLTRVRGATLDDGNQHCRLSLDPKNSGPVSCLMETADAH